MLYLQYRCSTDVQNQKKPMLMTGSGALSLLVFFFYLGGAPPCPHRRRAFQKSKRGALARQIKNPRHPRECRCSSLASTAAVALIRTSLSGLCLFEKREGLVASNKSVQQVHSGVLTPDTVGYFPRMFSSTPPADSLVRFAL